MQIGPVISLTCLLTLSLNVTAFDCKKAKTPVEIAICQDAPLKQQDDTLNKHYRSLLAVTGDKKSLIALQLNWIKQRDSACASAADIKSCLKSKYDERVDQLKIIPKNGVHGALMPVFAFKRCNKNIDANINYAAYKFIRPTQKGEFVFNQAVEELWADAKCTLGDSNNYSAQLTMPKPFITSKLISVGYEGDRCEGVCAGTQVFTGSIHLHMNTGEQLTFGELFNSTVVDAIATSCLNSLEQKHGETIEDLSVTLGNIAGAITDLSFWRFDINNATIKFSPYAIAPGVYGVMECDLAQSIVRKYIKPTSPWHPGHQ